MLIIEPGKSEIAFVCDKGNSCIRFIKSVHSFNVDKFIGKLKLVSAPVNWKPEGLAIIEKTRLAFTEGKSVHLVKMDNSFTAGQLIQIADNLESPRGLCLSTVPDKVLVADSHTVKEIEIESKVIKVVAKGFKMAFDVAVSSSGNIGVSDVQANKIALMKRTNDGTFKIDTSAGCGETGCCDGPASKAQLLEPTGMCFDFKTLLFCCFGGKNNRYIRVYTTLEFACVFMEKIRQIYDSTGFLEKKEHNRIARVGVYTKVEYADGLQKLLDSLSYLENFIKQRKAFLNTSPAGPEGTMYHISVNGFAETVLSLQRHLNGLKSAGQENMLPNLNLYAFTNESRKEHGPNKTAVLSN